jgi:hypothetical protein
MKKSMLQHGKDKLALDDIGTSPMNHDENLRANALALACRYYVETICKEGDLYREMIRDNRVLKPATYCGVIEVAFAFEAFIKGELKKTADEVLEPTTMDEALDKLTEKDREIPAESLDPCGTR